MLSTDIFDIETAFGCFRKRLAFVIARRMNPLLAMRLSADDVLQETFLSVLKRCDFIRSDPDVPIYFKFRKIALQTLADLERTHIQYQRRSQLKEVSGENADKAFCILPADIPTPRSVLARKERHALLRQIVNDLPETDRQILILRHFDGMGNKECADALGIEQKAASIRYVRALRKLHERIQSFSEFST